MREYLSQLAEQIKTSWAEIQPSPENNSGCSPGADSGRFDRNDCGIESTSI